MCIRDRLQVDVLDDALAAWSIPGGESIIKDIDLELGEGKLVVVTGPNGGGKTSLAKLIAGVETLSGGRIIFDGEDITDMDVTQRAKKGLAYAFQQPVRFKGLTVRDMLCLLYTSGIQGMVGDLLASAGVSDVLTSLVVDGIIGGVGAVLGFAPQMAILFLFLSILEDCGYMVRIAFVMDRIFRHFGLSGKSFIPLMISSGCGVPGIMASKTCLLYTSRCV